MKRKPVSIADLIPEVHLEIFEYLDSVASSCLRLTGKSLTLFILPAWKCGTSWTLPQKRQRTMGIPGQMDGTGKERHMERMDMGWGVWSELHSGREIGNLEPPVGEVG